MAKKKTTKTAATKTTTKAAKTNADGKTATKTAGNTKTATKKTATKKLSALDAAAKVLETAKEPMASKQLIEAMEQQKLWTSPGGKTPHATLYAAMLREINTKGQASRFTKTDRGRFALNAKRKEA